MLNLWKYKGLAFGILILGSLGSIDCNGGHGAQGSAGGEGGTTPVSVLGLYVPTSSNMSCVRVEHSATLLDNGDVLITGGSAGSRAEYYSPNDNLFHTIASNPGGAGGSAATATRLKDGRVLVVLTPPPLLTPLEVYIYNPFTQTFSASGHLIGARMDFTATLLQNGRVLIAGGCPFSGPSAEVYDPVSGTSTPTRGDMVVQRLSPSATLLPDGMVLLAGGNALSSAELYDPIQDFFIPTATNMAVNQGTTTSGLTATLLANGKVLMVGGDPLAGLGAEIYDPPTKTFVRTGSMLFHHANLAAAPLLNGSKVLVAGGYDTTCGSEIYDIVTGTFSKAAKMNSDRMGGHTATTLPNGNVLVAGGLITSSAELFKLN